MQEVKRNAIPGQNKLLDEYKNRTTMNGFSHISNVNDNINKENLNQNEINEINYLCNINKFCKEIMEKYIHYLANNN